MHRPVTAACLVATNAVELVAAPILVAKNNRSPGSTVGAVLASRDEPTAAAKVRAPRLRCRRAGGLRSRAVLCAALVAAAAAAPAFTVGAQGAGTRPRPNDRRAGGQTRHQSAASRSPTPQERRWADSVLATLSLRGKVGQLFLRWIPGTFRDTAARDFADARRWITQDSLGGFIISIGSPAELAAKTNALQRLSRVPLIFAADLEFGPGQRLVRGGAVFPPPMGIAATGDTTLSCAHGRVTARQARAVGIRWIFAPVVDVNEKPANPIVNTRAYSDRPAVVARFAVPFIRCAEAAGVLTTAKHFAAHGSADVDSHLATPVVAIDRARLDSEALAPFRAAQRAGASALMSAHVALPALTGDSVPISLNPKALGSIVREQWRFGGVIVTDALWMGGATRAAADPGELAVRAILAGNDVVLDPVDHRGMMIALERAVRAGQISVARLDSSVRRVLLAKARAGLIHGRYVDVRTLRRNMDLPRSDSLASRAARRSLVFARGSAAQFALGSVTRGDTVAVLAYLDESEHPAPGLSPGAAFTDELRTRLAKIGVAVDAVLFTAKNPPSPAEAAARVRRARAVVLAPYVRPLALKGTIDMPPAVRAAYRAALTERPDAAVVSFGDPYLERQLPGVRTHLLAWNPWSVWAERAAARALLGVERASGTLPITLPDAAGVRAITVNPALLGRLRDSVRAVVERAVADGAFPGAIAVVGSRDRVLATHSAGRIDHAAGAPAPNDRTLWDVASLTKVVGMTSAVMQLVESGRVSLEAPVQRYLPEWTGRNKERVTVRHLLTHSSGLPAFKQYFKDMQNPGAATRDTMLHLMYSTALDSAPGARMVYSDIGAILLGEIVERVSGERIDAYLARHVFGPLGMTDTRYLPAGEGGLERAQLVSRIAPTEVDPWRGRHLRGEVHDENAYALGGVSAHAGLFSSARDMTRFAQLLLGAGRLGDVGVFAPATVELFTTRADARFSSRALGWDTPSGSNSAGHLMSPRAFGHTGYTGTSIWVDPAQDVFVLLLSNRVNPTRQNQKIGAVRVALANAVMSVVEAAALGYGTARTPVTAPPSPSPTRATP